MGFASGQSLVDGWGEKFSLVEQNAVRGLRGRNTPVQEGWGTIGEGSLRSLGVSRQMARRGEVFTTALLLDVRSGLWVISKGESEREPGRRGQTLPVSLVSCQNPGELETSLWCNT